jgi:small subunit ribosomal protein S20
VWKASTFWLAKRTIIDIKGKIGTVDVLSSEETKESFMPIKRASVKDVRKTKTRTAYNTEHRAKTKLALDMARKSGYAPEKVVDAVKQLDKLAQKAIVHKNTAARKKSRLMKKANAAKVATKATAS